MMAIFITPAVYNTSGYENIFNYIVLYVYNKFSSWVIDPEVRICEFIANFTQL